MTHGSENDFWETAFRDKKEMWGHEPAQSAVSALKIFSDLGLKNILVPGIGYGRNARVFIEAGMSVTGIEVSQTAIGIAQRHFGDKVRIYHGSVTDMPFDALQYDGIFCYALIHLLGAAERKKLIADCYEQLAEGGCMIFTVISKQAATYGQGKQIGPDRFEQFGGVQMYFYDEEAIQREFADAGLVDIHTVSENFPFYMITCKK